MRCLDVVGHFTGRCREIIRLTPTCLFQKYPTKNYGALRNRSVGSEVGTALETFRVPYVVIEVDPDMVETLRSRGVFCLFGDATHERILQEANTQNALLVIVTLPESSRSQLVIRNIRRQNPSVPIVTRSHSRSDHEALLEAGATEIIQPELEASATMIRHALDSLKLPGDQTSAYLERFREAVGTAHAVTTVTQASLPDVYEFEVDGPPLADKSLREARIRERFGVTVVAVRKSSGEVLINPPAETVINTGDRIRVFGLRDQIDDFIPLQSRDIYSHKAAYGSSGVMVVALLMGWRDRP